MTEKMNINTTRNEKPLEPITGAAEFSEKMYNSADLEPLPFFPESTISGASQLTNMIRIPCRARGVCDSHTPSSAYFEIPKDCPHGKMLVCNHVSCRKSGRQFRYCKVCDQVTAKRNFSKRHAHGDYTIQTPEGGKEDVMGDDSTNGKKRKVTLDDVEAKSLASLLHGAMARDDSASETETSVDVPSTVYAPREGDEESATTLMMVTKEEASLLELVRRQSSNDMGPEYWIQQVLLATDPILVRNEQILEDDIFSDSEEEKGKSRQMSSSLNMLSFFTESFDKLYMK